MPAESTRARPRRSTAATAAGVTAARVLVADDNADMREYLTSLLQQRRLPGRRRRRRPAGAGGHPRPDPRPRHQRRDDAPAGRPAAGRGAADGPAHRGPARPAAVRARRAGGLDRGPAGRRRRLPRQAVRRRGAARPGAREHRAGAAAQPPRPLAHGAGRLVAGGVLRLRRAGRRHRDQRRVHRHPRLRPGQPALPRRPPVVAGRRHRTRSPPAGRGGVRADC